MGITWEGDDLFSSFGCLDIAHMYLVLGVLYYFAFFIAHVVTFGSLMIVQSTQRVPRNFNMSPRHPYMSGAIILSNPLSSCHSWAQQVLGISALQSIIMWSFG